MKSYSLALAGGVLLALSQMAQAAAITTLVGPTTVTINSTSYDVYQLQVADDSSWLNQHLTLNLTQGTMYQDPNGYPGGGPLPDTSPNPRDPAADFATEQYDTFVAIPQGYPNATTPAGRQGTAASIDGDVNPSSTHLFVDWHTATQNTAAGTYITAQITVTHGAIGTFSGTTWDVATAGVGTPYSGTIGASPIPEPASVAALSLGAVALLSRRRRRRA